MTFQSSGILILGLSQRYKKNIASNLYKGWKKAVSCTL
jgi:hypothetical protein